MSKCWAMACRLGVPGRTSQLGKWCPLPAHHHRLGVSGIAGCSAAGFSRVVVMLCCPHVARR
eukprot:6655295-Prorocentrum_lima.AAC.1